MTEPMKTELEDAIQKANRALDVPNADPDDDLRLISRQFLRLLDKNERQVSAERERIKEKLRKDWEPIIEGSAYFEKKFGQLIDSL